MKESRPITGFHGSFVKVVYPEPIKLILGEFPEKSLNPALVIKEDNNDLTKCPSSTGVITANITVHPKEGH
jgi:hypothetical protein